MGSTFLKDIESAVGAAETRTDAEIVVAIAPSSGSYRDLDHRFGAALSLVVLVLEGQTPPIERVWSTLAVVVAYVVGTTLASRVGFVRRLMSSRRRRRAQVARAARLTFVEEQVHATRDRHGVLLYVSELEGIADVVADVGLEGKVDPGRLYDVSREVCDAGCSERSILDAVAKLGELLATAFPKKPGDTNEIPNAPRVVDGGSA